MPSPGFVELGDRLAPITYRISGFDVEIRQHSLILRLARAMHAGWTSASPTTTTTMRAAMLQEFSDFSGGYGTRLFEAIGIGIDGETAQWAGSWNSTTHTYTVNMAETYTKIMAAMPIDTEATRAIANKAAQVFWLFFEAEVG
ncbi:MAG: hypothetical protein CMI13_12190 [Oleibacter sp.]|nr:hypothetical protein [Thalassolituus sp.]